MTAWNITPPMIDNLLRDDRDYSISFARDIGIPSGPNNDTWTERVYTRHGVDDTLEAMAQILVTMSKGNFEIPLIDTVKDELLQFIADQVRLPGQLKEIQEIIARSTERIEQAEDQNDPTVRFAVQALEDSRQMERDLVLRLAMKGGLIKAAQLGVQFVETLDKIIVDTKSGDLNLDAVVPQEMLNMGHVPQDEPRKTVGALVYYYVHHMACQPMVKADGSNASRGWMARSPKASILIEPIA